MPNAKISILSGNVIIIGSSTIVIVALTWAGISYSWSSVHVLVPLILGFVGLAAFLVYEDMVAVEPVVPWRIVSNRTSALGYGFHTSAPFGALINLQVLDHFPPRHTGHRRRL